ncbi:RNA polymerase sigma-70 factor (ECF subfamily) [Kribbella voronezhensis]|uniref:RNA polymerase sigma-70 factor (ECF subfamily) n=1 Tax=Kribbella voronezhensis TaxID=2512212 RepID=A0A4R7TH13_9ACTN|nr:RNA polymerase sigma factor [Kribbella voronezhensis]TDU91612.1 RNA polymerase sigma-70 factor (ECF subfamily) [Kribbella voronezhensis]
MTDERAGATAPPADGAAFVDWVRPHLAAMARLAARLAVGADRDDIVQESLARAWMKRQQYDASRGTASSWLLAITADQARKAARRLRPVAELGDHDAAEARPDVEARVDVDQALARLSARQRLAVDCYYFADLSIGDTAAVMGCSEGTVKSTLSDARARLRSLLEVSE